jgi:hydrogenase nickel incorporation protein HypA/HybF
MHELSLSYGLVESVLEALPEDALRVESLTLRLGELSGVDHSALEFSFPLAAAGTLVDGAQLLIEAVPVSIYCLTCQTVRTLPSVQSFRCPVCQEPSGDIRAGRELDLVRIEYTTREESNHEHAHTGTAARRSE